MSWAICSVRRLASDCSRCDSRQVMLAGCVHERASFVFHLADSRIHARLRSDSFRRSSVLLLLLLPLALLPLLSPCRDRLLRPFEIRPQRPLRPEALGTVQRSPICQSRFRRSQHKDGELKYSRDNQCSILMANNEQCLSQSQPFIPYLLTEASLQKASAHAIWNPATATKNGSHEPPNRRRKKTPSGGMAMPVKFAILQTQTRLCTLQRSYMYLGTYYMIFRHSMS